MNKDLRAKVYAKYDNRCAYCGSMLDYKDMEVDHIEPKFIGGKDDIDNLNPACRKCNRFKGVFSVEGFRKELSMQVDRLLKNPQFLRALNFDQIRLNQHKVTFYFEEV